MKFTPKTEEEIQAGYVLLEDGEYDFTVIKAEEKISKPGNEYIALVLQIFDNKGKERSIYTNLAFTKLLKHFCDTTGLSHKYESGELNPEDCIFKMGKCVVKTEESRPNPMGGFYPAKNIIDDYIFSNKVDLSKKEVDSFDTQDVPF